MRPAAGTNPPRLTPRRSQRTTKSSPAAAPVALSSNNTTTSKPPRKRKGFVLTFLSCMVLAATSLTLSLVPKDETHKLLRHPLASRQMSEPQGDKEIRYLTFGSSSTWGKGLEDSNTAYPWLLSSTVHNAASQVGGQALSALCTQSIVGDGIYDVIVIEFVEETGVKQLARRLRKRFPKALMVFVQLWSPANIFYGNHNNGTDAVTWAGKLSLHSEAFRTAFIASDLDKWSFDITKPTSLVEEIIQEVDGQLVSLPFPENPKTVFQNSDIMSMFQEDHPELLSERGHAMIAESIWKIVEQDHILQRNNRNVLGSWGDGDSCNLWYSSGDYSSVRARRRTALSNFAKETNGHKHALEVSWRGGSIDVVNPFDDERMLYLTYMTANTDDSRKVYPRTKITLAGKPSVIVEPVHDESSDVHLTRTTAVGVVQSGKTTVRLDCLDASKNRFRLVGIHFLPVGRLPLPFEFQLEPDPAH